MRKHIDNFSFEEKYRPRNLDEIILPERYKNKFKNGIKNSVILWSRTPGTGKSSLAKLLIEQFNHPFIYINCSLNTSIELLRTDILYFCTTNGTGFQGDNNKVVFLDEFDGASINFYEALRGFMNDYSHIKFIATCNDLNGIPDALKERRFEVIDFEFSNEDTVKLQIEYVKRIKYICDNENIKIDGISMKSLIKKYYPNMGSIITLIEGFVLEGRTLIELKDINSSYSFQNLFNIVFENNKPYENYNTIIENFTGKINTLLSSFTFEFPKYVKEVFPQYIDAIPLLIIKIGEYQRDYKNVNDELIIPLALIYELQLIIQKFKK